MTVNFLKPDFDEPRTSIPGFHARRARLGHQLRTERLGLSFWILDAGQVAYPYHFHLAEEEVLVVLGGTPLLRTPDGWHRLAEGELVRFAPGEPGAHQLVNDTDADVRFLALSTHGQPDVVIYPDEGKLCAAERRPDGSGLKTFFHLADHVPYGAGVLPPEVPRVDAA